MKKTERMSEKQRKESRLRKTKNRNSVLLSCVQSDETNCMELLRRNDSTHILKKKNKKRDQYCQWL